MSVKVPEGYRSLLDIRQTEIAIKKVKDFFERDLAIQLNLTRVSTSVCRPQQRYERYIERHGASRQL